MDFQKDLVIDQGLCYTATEFKEFCQSRLVKHTLEMDTLKEPYKKLKRFFTNVSQRAVTLTYCYSIELLPRPQERKLLQNYLDAHTEICYLTSR